MKNKQKQFSKLSSTIPHFELGCYVCLLHSAILLTNYIVSEHSSAHVTFYIINEFFLESFWLF